MITVKSAKFLYSRTKVEHSNICEVCFCGRSNAGKSSLINMLVGQKNLSRTSSEPGRTRLINYFEIVLVDSITRVEKVLHLVDLPGYGYAKVDRTKKALWDEMIDDYIKNSDTLSLCIAIVDSKIKLQNSDIVLIDYLYKLGVSFIVVGAKIDRLNKTQVISSKSEISATLKMGRDDIIMASSVNKLGKETILCKLYNTVEVFEMQINKNFTGN